MASTLLVTKKSLKTRQQGNSIAITIPRVAGVTADQEYNFEQFSDGTLVYKPVKSDNFWATLDMTEAEVQQEIEDEIEELGYDPANQTPFGPERVVD